MLSQTEHARSFVIRTNIIVQWVVFVRMGNKGSMEFVHSVKRQ